MKLEALNDHCLVARADESNAAERGSIVDVLDALVEIERRQLHLSLGYSSVWDWLTRRWHYSKGSAFRRMHVARLITRFPVIRTMLLDGDMNLSTVAALRDVLTDENCEAVLRESAGKTEDEVRNIAAAIKPRPPNPDRVRELLVSAELSSPRIEAVDGRLLEIRITVTPEFMADLEKAKALLSHKLPGRDGRRPSRVSSCGNRSSG